MKVGFTTFDWATELKLADGTPALGGSGHIRIAQYLPHLTLPYSIGGPVFHTEKRIFGVHRSDKMKWWYDDGGHEHLVTTAPDYEDCDFDCDVIYTQRNMHHMGAQLIAEARANGQIIINDIDDWYWGLHKGNPAYDRTDPKKNPMYNRDAYAAALKVSSAVVCSTPFLLEKMLEWNPRTYMLENHVETDKFAETRWDHHHPDDPARVGWVGSTAYRSGDLAVVKPFVKQFLWVHAGHAPKAPSFCDETGIKEIQVLPQVIAKHYPTIFRFDVGTVPLNDIPFNHAKSWIKGLEYVAAGIPFVATPVPEYRRLQDEYGVGILAKKTAHWVKHIRRLLEDEDLRIQMAAENLEAIRPLDVVEGARKLQEFLEASA